MTNQPTAVAWLYFREEEDPDARWVCVAEYYDLDVACHAFERYTDVDAWAIAEEFRSGVLSFETDLCKIVSAL